ncbi:MAG TPA: hypothetical protein VF981_15170 [Gemmatimonadaceae bacterium]
MTDLALPDRDAFLAAHHWVREDGQPQPIDFTAQQVAFAFHSRGFGPNSCGWMVFGLLATGWSPDAVRRRIGEAAQYGLTQSFDVAAIDGVRDAQAYLLAVVAEYERRYAAAVDAATTGEPPAEPTEAEAASVPHVSALLSEIRDLLRESRDLLLEIRDYAALADTVRRFRAHT